LADDLAKALPSHNEADLALPKQGRALPNHWLDLPLPKFGKAKASLG